MHSVNPITVGNDYPRSVSSGVSVTGSSRPTTQPNSDDECEGGITDDAGEGKEHGNLSGNAMRAETLKSYYGGRSKTSETGVSIGTNIDFVTHNVSEQIHSLARIVPTTLVPSFVKPNASSRAAAAHAWRKKGDIHLGDLPRHLQSDFTTKLTPRLYELLGTLSAWEQPADDDIQELWMNVFPQERSLDFGSKDGIIVIKLVTCS